MSQPVICRGCGRRMCLPDTIDRARARCPKCLTKVEPSVAPPAAQAPDAYQAFSESQAIPKVVPPPKPVRKAEPEAAPADGFPPPFRTPVHVLSDSMKQFRGPLQGVLTPHGLFLEAEPERPLLFIPVGSRSSATVCDLDVALPGRRLDMRFMGTHDPDQLAADTAAFLAGQRPVPLPAEYRPPWWLAGVGAIFAVGLATGPVILAAVSEAIAIGPAIALSIVFAVLATLANAGIAVFTSLPTAAKIGSMAALNAALLGLFIAGAMIFLREEPSAEPPPPPPKQQPAPPAPPAEPPPPPMPPEPPPPVTRNEFIQKDGHTHFEDAPTDVTAIANLPNNGGVLVAHADGSTRIWSLDQATFEPPRLGPRTPSPIRRVTFGKDGKSAIFTCDTGLVFMQMNMPNRPAVLIPGGSGTLFSEKNRDRFAVIRNDRVQVRYLPTELIKEPPAIRAKGGFVTTVSQDETLPLGVAPAGLATPGGKPTFLAWHPGGRLIAGHADGTIASLALGAGVPFASNEHKGAAVRVWELTPNGDFIFGDEKGFIGWWPNKTTKITKFRAGETAVKALVFNPVGGEIAVVQAGGVSLWLSDGQKLGDVPVKGKPNSVCFSARDGVLLVGVGGGVEAIWVPELAKRIRPMIDVERE